MVLVCGLIAVLLCFRLVGYAELWVRLVSLVFGFVDAGRLWCCFWFGKSSCACVFAGTLEFWFCGRGC